jgi:hypothetical protein
MAATNDGARYGANWQDEIDGAALYRTLAEVALYPAVEGTVADTLEPGTPWVEQGQGDDCGGIQAGLGVCGDVGQPLVHAITQGNDKIFGRHADLPDTIGWTTPASKVRVSLSSSTISVSVQIRGKAL